MNSEDPDPPADPVVTSFLEMLRPDQLSPAAAPRPGLCLRPARQPCPDLNRMFFAAVGRDWHWQGRLAWPPAKWAAYVSRPELSTWLGYVEDTPCGYFELEASAGRDVEIAIFGLLPGFIGQGLGGWLLTEAVRTAWERGAKRVWLHTCSKDHPAALPNYQARGFRLYHRTTDPVRRTVPGFAG